MLVMAVTFITGNLKDCLAKELILLKLLLITANLDHHGTKTRVEFNGSCLKIVLNLNMVLSVEHC